MSTKKQDRRVNTTVKCQKCKVGKIISKNILSTVFDGSFGKQKCIWKIEHINQKDHDNKKSKPWNEVNFSLDFANKHPQHFMKLLHHHVADCSGVKLILDHPPAVWGPKLVQEYKDIVKDNICLHKAYTKMDVILNNVLGKLKLPQIYSMILQMNYALKLLKDNDYIHGDFHFGNVGAVKCASGSKKKLGNMVVRTFGYDWKLIDFGLTMHKKDVKTKEDRYRFNRGEKASGAYLYSFATLIQSPDNDLSHKEIVDAMEQTPEYESIKALSKNVDQISCLFMTLYPEKYLTFLKGKGKILATNVLPLADLVILAHHDAESDAVRDYFYEKLKLY